MGIKHLNKFLLNNCSKNGIYKCHFSKLANKTIVIDISIYLYKFIAKNALLENIYLMISVMKYYNIIPVFIFDGKPPIEKKELLYKRKMKKKEAEKEYKELQLKINSEEHNLISPEEYQDIQEKMEYLKTQFIRITDSDIQIVKKLINACGVEYYDADGEADILCCQLVLNGKAWACISDDMDMFVYGCPRVIRQISLMNHTCIFYDINNILKDLDMSMSIFREIMVLSGTDYNTNENINLHETIKWYNEYLLYLNNNKDCNITFYNWLLKYTKYIQNIDLLLKTHDMFIINYNHIFNNKTFKINEKNKDDLMCILAKEGFI